MLVLGDTLRLTVRCGAQSDAKWRTPDIRTAVATRSSESMANRGYHSGGPETLASDMYYKLRI
jgi:hypothetical protein|eukprot:COSAG01_NODE_8240_length_2857_cov_2.810145_4_plen_63_part_00